MFILTNFDIDAGVVQIFDTKDNTNECISLNRVARLVRSRKLSVKGIGIIGKSFKTGIPIMNYGVYLNPDEAQTYIKRYYEGKLN